MNSTGNLLIGLFFITCAIVTFVVLIVVQRAKDLTDFTVLTFSDTLATMSSGILFLMNLRDTTQMDGDCNPVDFAMVMAMHMVPAINGFLSMAAWAFQTMNHVQNYVKQPESPKTFMQRHSQYLGALPSWFMPLFAMLPILFSQPNMTRTIATEQCATEFAITKTICNDYVGFNENNTSNIDLGGFETIFLSSNLTEPINNTLEEENIAITKENIIQRIYSIVNENITLQHDTLLRHASGNKTHNKRTTYRQNDDPNYYLDFLTNALAIAAKQNVDDNSSLFRPLIWFNNTAFTKVGSNTRPQADPGKDNVLIMGGLAPVNLTSKDNVGVGQIEISDAEDVVNKPLTNMTIYMDSNLPQMYPHSTNMKPDSTTLQHVMDFVKKHKNSTNRNQYNNLDCYVECSLPESFSKRLLFFILLICYFVPTVLSVSFQMQAANGLQLFDMQRKLSDKAEGRTTYDGSQNVAAKRVMELSRNSAITSILLLSPSFLNTVSKSIVCLKTPSWISSVFLLLAHSHSAFRSVFNITILKSCLGNYSNIEPITEQRDIEEITKGISKTNEEILIIEGIEDCVSGQVTDRLPK